ncbi:MAG: membrane protein insertase YidC [Cypionkella sp.]
MDDQNKNLVLTTVLCFLVILGWFVVGPKLFPAWFPDPEAVVATAPTTDPAANVPGTEAAAVTSAPVASTEPLPEAPRLTIDTPMLAGSISLLGGRLDDLELKTFKETLEKDSPDVRMLSPVGKTAPYYAVFGWAPGAGLTADDVPGAKSEWKLASGGTLSVGQPVSLKWDNAKGMSFVRTISVDDNFMFTVSDKVQNNGTAAASLYNYGIIARHGLPKLQNIYVVHEGLVRRTDGSLEEIKYKKITGLPQVASESAQAEVKDATTDGWIGFTDHYWMTTLIPEQGKPYTSVVKYVAGADIYQAEVREPLVTIAPGAAVETSTQLFAGAKVWETIGNYENDPSFLAKVFGAKVDPDRPQIKGFIDSIDWGWFYFLTKPIFMILHLLHGWIGNMGLAIIGLTFFLKLLVLPLAYKSYVSMARMKELQPEIEALKERTGEDKQKMQKEMMQLYKEKKVNPAAGCLPILIQIPIFFSLYKVIFVTLELRQAPFFGWLNDLSAPDSSSLFNLFGALPWAAPVHGTLLATIFIGALPILLGVSMWLQQKLNPAPADPVQQQIFAWMPWVFMFMLGGFASGLVVYWITNNTITFTQQYLIMRSHGHKPDIFGNIKSGFGKKQLAVEAKAKRK